MMTRKRTPLASSSDALRGMEPQPRYSRRGQSGVGLIEVLVALLVVSIGVLGIAGLQLTGMKQSTNGFNRTKASMLAEELAARMRINNVGVTAQAYAGFDSSAEAGLCNSKPAPYCQASLGVDAASCTPNDLAAFDLFTVSCGDWGRDSAEDGVEGRLPEGASLVVNCDDSPCAETSSYTLVVSWPENRTASSDDDVVTRQVQMRIRP